MVISFFPFTFVGKPAMLHVRSNEHEFDIADLFNMVANNTLSCLHLSRGLVQTLHDGAGGSQNLFCTGENGKAIILGEGE